MVKQTLSMLHDDYAYVLGYLEEWRVDVGQPFIFAKYFQLVDVELTDEQYLILKLRFSLASIKPYPSFI